MLQARLDPISTYSDWIISILLRDSETGDHLDLTGCSVELGVRKTGDQSVTTVATTSGGEITFPDTGYIHAQILYGDYAFDIGEYDVRLKLSRDGFTESFIIGTLPVIDGMKE